MFDKNIVARHTVSNADLHDIEKLLTNHILDYNKKLELYSFTCKWKSNSQIQYLILNQILGVVFQTDMVSESYYYQKLNIMKDVDLISQVY